MAERDTDPFTYGDGNLATVSSGKWTALSAFLDCVVASNEVIGASTTDHADVITSWAFGNDQYSEVTFHGPVGYGSFPAGPTVRSNAVDAAYLLAVLNTNWTVYKMPAFTVLAGPTAVTPADGDVWRIEATGGATTTLKVYRNGVQQGSNITDSSSALTTGKPGIFANRNTCTPMTAWAAGDFSTPGAPAFAQLDSLVRPFNMTRGRR